MLKFGGHERIVGGWQAIIISEYINEPIKLVFTGTVDFKSYQSFICVICLQTNLSLDSTFYFITGRVPNTLNLLTPPSGKIVSRTWDKMQPALSRDGNSNSP